MRILLINVPHPSIGSRIPDDHLPPLGLLAIGGPLLDDGHEVLLIDGEFGPMSTQGLVAAAMAFAPDAVLFGHSGSTSGHPVIAEVARAVSAALPGVRVVYGGVYLGSHSTVSQCRRAASGVGIGWDRRWWRASGRRGSGWRG